MASCPDIQIERWTPDSSHPAADVAGLADLLKACVDAGASVSFIQPFSLTDAGAFWNCKILRAVQTGRCRALLARNPGRQIVGTVQLDLATPPNQSHRGEVRKLLVHPAARRRGIARALMLAIEQEAREANRTLLSLDTVTGGFAESLYLSRGYTKSGIIPGFARRPDSLELEATTILYKQLVPLP